MGTNEEVLPRQSFRTVESSGLLERVQGDGWSRFPVVGMVTYSGDSFGVLRPCFASVFEARRLPVWSPPRVLLLWMRVRKSVVSERSWPVRELANYPLKSLKGVRASAVPIGSELSAGIVFCKPNG